MENSKTFKAKNLAGYLPLEKEFSGLGAVRSIAFRLLHAGARYLPMHPRWRVAIHRFRGVKIGTGVFIGGEVFIENSFPDSIIIEDYVAITNGTFIVGHFIYPLHLKRVLGQDRLIKRGVTLKKGCLIGPRCVITDGVTVGECAIIGAGSVVTKDIPECSIAVGNPAKVIKTFKKDDVLYYDLDQ